MQPDFHGVPLRSSCLPGPLRPKVAALLLVICAPGLLTGAGTHVGEPAADGLPNIVFVLIDDMGWPDLGCYGHLFHETPHIDRLCARGMKFTDFYAATPVCSSTRSTIQSGQYSARTGITDFIPGHWRPFEKLVVPPIEGTLPEAILTPGDVLRAAGYATGYFGKWHLGPDATHGPDTRGYEVTARDLGDDFEAWRTTRGPGPKQIDLLTDQALWFIERNRHRPFFVTLSHHAVHIPLEATPGAIEKYEKKPKPPAGVNNPVYAAMIEDLDRSVGRLLGALDELGLAERTLVVFTSDNGGLQRTFTGVGELVSTNAPLRDEKGTLYEGGIRVPMIVRWPGVVEPGTVCREPATTADLMPTFCEAAGAKLPEQPIDGASLVPLLKNAGAALDREAIYFHYPHYHHSRPAGAIRAGDWKLVEFFDGASLELYHLGDDLGETVNLAAKMPEKAEHLQRKLAAWREAVGARMPAPNPDYDPRRAPEWWNRRTNQPIDVDALQRRYRSRAAKKQRPGR
jgi:uncharacterized sulfatase